MSGRYDVVIVGAANAALCAAHAAREQVERVLVLEKAPRERAGGNTFFTAGAFRVACVMKFADFMGRVRTMSVKASSWKELFFPEVHKLPGS